MPHSAGFEETMRSFTARGRKQETGPLAFSSAVILVIIECRPSAFRFSDSVVKGDNEIVAVATSVKRDFVKPPEFHSEVHRWRVPADENIWKRFLNLSLALHSQKCLGPFTESNIGLKSWWTKDERGGAIAFSEALKNFESHDVDQIWKEKDEDTGALPGNFFCFSRTSQRQMLLRHLGTTFRHRAFRDLEYLLYPNGHWAP